MTKVQKLVILHDVQVEVAECGIEYLKDMKAAAFQAVDEYNQAVWDCAARPSIKSKR